MKVSTTFGFAATLLVSAAAVTARPFHSTRSHTTHSHFHTRRAAAEAAATAGASTGNPTQLTVDGLLQIVPAAANCTGAEFPDECRTASQALPHILQSFADFKITHPAVQAALVSLMAYESGGLQYNMNHYPKPGRPGQGTRNMQMENYNVLYAQSLGASAETTSNVTALMDLVGADEHSFASAAWFVVSQCPYSIRQGMWDGSVEGWQLYLQNCVGASPTEGNRQQLWQTAKQVLGVA